MNSRTQSGNSLIVDGGNKIKAFINDFKLPASLNQNSDSSDSSDSNVALNSVLIGIGIVAVYILRQKFK